ncbi:MAG: NAD(P)H-dependent oxidoreductase [Proteobacteria bacterium]|nr:NAD(P)H-dependent oxidoreductase [Pseudomonadota bacterium]
MAAAPNPASPGAPAPPAGVLVIAAHPLMEQSRVNRRLMQAARRAGASVHVRDLYALYPDYLIDVAAEQALLESARLVVWQHPIHWYSMPPLMKLWVDDVLAFGWAYGPGGTALQGKDLWLVASTGGSEDSYRPDSYNRYFFDAFLPPYEQTAALCGMRFLPPLMLHGAHKLDDELVAEHERIYVDRLASYPRWPEIASMDERPTCDVPSSARPAEAEAEGAA